MSGNGVDIGAVYQAIIALSRDLQGFRGKTTRNLLDLRQEVTELHATLTQYHSSVVGHGILISEAKLGESTRP